MIERARIERRAAGGGNYFAAPAKGVDFFSTGCTLLDCAIGGGWAEKRIINIVGDKSTGKTLLAMEAASNFANKYPKGKIYYREAEAAFDVDYAAALGAPMDRIQLLPEGEIFETVEDFFEDLREVAKKNMTPEKKPKFPILYILDSLDALSDRTEMAREIDKGSYGANKAKQLSEMFRRIVRPLGEANITLIIISQVRDKIGVTFGEKTTRSGGKALDFYASQCVYLAHIGTISKEMTINGAKIKRAVGLDIKAKCKKNKVGVALREAEFSIKFGYGIDDVKACLKWLKDTGGYGNDNEAIGGMKDTAFAKWAAEEHGPEVMRAVGNLTSFVKRRWSEIETHFLPKKGKYSQCA